MTELISAKRRKLNDIDWYCVRGNKESKEPAWPYCTMEYDETKHDLVYDNPFDSRTKCDNICGRFEERIQNQIGKYLDRSDIENLVKSAGAKNAGFLETKNQYRDYALLDQLLNDQRSHEKLNDTAYVKQLLYLITKPETANWRFATNMIRELAIFLYEPSFNETKSMYSIEMSLKQLMPIFQDKSKKAFYEPKETSRYLFEAVLIHLKNCKFATYLVEKGLLDIVKSSEYDEKILVFFVDELYHEMENATPKWLCWDKLFHTFVGKTNFLQLENFYGSPGSQDVAQFFGVVENKKKKFKDFQIKSATKFLTTPQAYDLGGAQVFIRHMFNYDILPRDIQLRFVDILEYLVNLPFEEMVKQIGSHYQVIELAKTYALYLKSDDPNRKSFAELLTLLAQEFEITTPSL